jgi:hypothetical protein
VHAHDREESTELHFPIQEDMKTKGPEEVTAAVEEEARHQIEGVDARNGGDDVCEVDLGEEDGKQYDGEDESGGLGKGGTFHREVTHLRDLSRTPAPDPVVPVVLRTSREHGGVSAIQV